MVVLDATIVNIALPSAQADLGFSDGGPPVGDHRLHPGVRRAAAPGRTDRRPLRPQVDLRRRPGRLRPGLRARRRWPPSFGLLFAARALQGVFGALLAPSALSLLTVTFAGLPDRAKAFGIFGAIAGGGASVGLSLGGCSPSTSPGAGACTSTSRSPCPPPSSRCDCSTTTPGRDRPRIDLPGVLTASAGLFALVYGFSNAEADAWAAPLTAAWRSRPRSVLLGFVLVERRATHPLLPLHIVKDRARGGAYAAIALAGSGIFGVFLFLTFYMQETSASPRPHGPRLPPHDREPSSRRPRPCRRGCWSASAPGRIVTPA